MVLTALSALFYNDRCVGLARTIYIQFIYGIFGRESPNIRSYTVYIYGSGKPYAYTCIAKAVHTVRR